MATKKITLNELRNLVKQIIKEEDDKVEEKVEELDNWIEENSDYIGEDSLKEKVKELFGGILGNVDSYVQTEKNSEGDEYGENWSRNLITITNNKKPLIEIWVTNDYRYDFGKNSIEFGFGERFKFNKDSL